MSKLSEKYGLTEDQLQNLFDTFGQEFTLEHLEFQSQFTWPEGMPTEFYF